MDASGEAEEGVAMVSILWIVVALGAVVAGVVIFVVFLVSRRKEPRGFSVDPPEQKR